MRAMYVAAAMFLLGAIVLFVIGRTSLGASNVALAAAFFAIGASQGEKSD